MLIGIDPLLGPRLLAILRAMGHGDQIAIVDANFPAAAIAKRCVRLEGQPLTRVLDAVLGVLPLDHFESAVCTMEAVGNPNEVPPAVQDIQERVKSVGYVGTVETLSRQDFYSAARNLFAVVATGEARIYGNVILRKGVIIQ